MTLRDTYSRHAHERQLSALVKKMQGAADEVINDIDIINRRVSMSGIKGLFAPLATGRLKGEWSRDHNTLSYRLVRDEVDTGLNYTTLLARMRSQHRDWMLVECKSKTNEDLERYHLPAARLHITAEMMERHGNAMRTHASYKALHEICADPSIDMRVELVVAATDGEGARARFRDMLDYYSDISGKVVATPRLEARIYLDQPYRASTDAHLGMPVKGDKPAPAERHGL